MTNLSLFWTTIMADPLDAANLHIPELIEEILLHISLHTQEGVRTLWSCRQVSQIFRQVVKRVSWRSLRVADAYGLIDCGRHLLVKDLKGILEEDNEIGYLVKDLDVAFRCFPTRPRDRDNLIWILERVVNSLNSISVTPNLILCDILDFKFWEDVSTRIRNVPRVRWKCDQLVHIRIFLKHISHSQINLTELEVFAFGEATMARAPFQLEDFASLLHQTSTTLKSLAIQWSLPLDDLRGT
jgi:hypothetical protein